MGISAEIYYYPEPKCCMERICLWRVSDRTKILNRRWQNRVDSYIPLQSAWILAPVLSPSHGEGTMTMAGGKGPVRLQFFCHGYHTIVFQWLFTLHTCYLEDCRQAMLWDVLSQSISPPKWWRQNYWYTCMILHLFKILCSNSIHLDTSNCSS